MRFMAVRKKGDRYDRAGKADLEDKRPIQAGQHPPYRIEGRRGVKPQTAQRRLRGRRDVGRSERGDLTGRLAETKQDRTVDQRTGPFVLLGPKRPPPQVMANKLAGTVCEIIDRLLTPVKTK